MDRATRPEGSLADVQRGWEVYSADEQQVGTVQEMGADHVVVRSGLFSGEDRTIPRSAIRRIEHDRVYLAVAKDAVVGQGWARAPQEAAGPARSASDGPPSIPESIGTPGLTGVVEEGGHLVRAGSRQEAGAPETDEQLGPPAGATPPAAQSTATVGTVSTDAGTTPAGSAPAGSASTAVGPADRTLRLHEEQLQVGTVRVPTGEVRVHKRVVTELRTMQVPVQRGEVVIEREGEVTVVDPGGTAASIPASGLKTPGRRLRARPAPLALSLGALGLLLLLGLRRSGRLGATRPGQRGRVAGRPTGRR